MRYMVILAALLVASLLTLPAFPMEGNPTYETAENQQAAPQAYQAEGTVEPCDDTATEEVAPAVTETTVAATPPTTAVRVIIVNNQYIYLDVHNKVMKVEKITKIVRTTVIKKTTMAKKEYTTRWRAEAKKAGMASQSFVTTRDGIVLATAQNYTDQRVGGLWTAFGWALVLSILALLLALYVGWVRLPHWRPVHY